MKLTWHIMKKDLTRLRWELAVWTGCLACLSLNAKRTIGEMTTMPLLLVMISSMMWVVLSVVIVAGIVQEDSLVASSVFWRTRPLSPARLLGAKLLLICGLFVVLPLFGISFSAALDAHKSEAFLQGIWRGGLFFSSASLLVAATASCTKNLGHCALAWLGSWIMVVATVALGSRLMSISPWLDRSRMDSDKMMTIFAVGVLVGVAVLCSQYLLRRRGLSIALLCGGSVGLGLIYSVWTWSALR